MAEGRRMNRCDILKRLDELSLAAQERMNAVKYLPNASYAEIMWMTDDEVAERHALIQSLPLYGEEAEAAKARLLARWKK